MGVVEVATVSQDQMEVSDQVQFAEVLHCHVTQTLLRKRVDITQQKIYEIVTVVSRRAANRAADIIQVFSNRAIEIKVVQYQAEVTELAAHAVATIIEVRDQVMVNQDQMGEVHRQAIHHNRRLVQVLLQVHQHQETMEVVEVVKAAVQADLADDNKIKNGVMKHYENVSQNILAGYCHDDWIPNSDCECAICRRCTEAVAVRFLCRSSIARNG